MCVIRRPLSYLSGIISDWVRKQGLGSALKMRKPEEEGIVIQSRDFSSCSLVHHPWGYYCGDDPVPQITKRAFRQQGRRIITLSLQAACSCDHLRVPWWIIHQERGWGPGLKESIKKMQWGREWWPTSGCTGCSKAFNSCLEAAIGTSRGSFYLSRRRPGLEISLLEKIASRSWLPYRSLNTIERFF